MVSTKPEENNEPKFSLHELKQQVIASESDKQSDNNS
jgi:hypothetical protein